MARALIWDGDDSFGPEDVLIGFSDRKASFLEYKAMGLLHAPYCTAYVAAEGRACIHLILHYLKTVKDLSISNSDDFHDPSFSQFLQTWRQKVRFQPSYLVGIDKRKSLIYSLVRQHYSKYLTFSPRQDSKIELGFNFRVAIKLFCSEMVDAICRFPQGFGASKVAPARTSYR